MQLLKIISFTRWFPNNKFSVSDMKFQLPMELWRRFHIQLTNWKTD